MQTFLPYPQFEKSLQCLDYRRLGKQRVEAFQILKALEVPGYGWRNHPAVLMWKGYKNALILYMNTAIEVWKQKGYNNNMLMKQIDGEVAYPHWFGMKIFMHRIDLIY